VINTKEYIKYIKSNVCLVCGRTPVDPDHLMARGMGGRGKGGTVTGSRIDFSCIPLCRVHHSERHQLPERDFEDLYRIKLWKEAFKLVRDYFVE